MTTAETVLVIILISLLIVYFIMCIAAMAITLKILSIFKNIAQKAEDVADSVESAAEIFRDTQGRLALFKLVRNIIKFAHDRSKK